MRRSSPLIGALDQGTSSTRFYVFAGDTGEVLTYHQIEVKQEDLRDILGIGTAFLDNVPFGEL